MSKLSESDQSVVEKAKRKFALLENGDPELTSQWSRIREITVDELRRTYSRLNVKMDHYHGESMYGNRHNAEVVGMLEARGLLKTLDDGRRVVDLDEDRRVVITKSDGSSLYITRDLAAAVHRKKLFDFDRMLYVVENGQENHFKNLIKLLERLGFCWASSSVEHVKFGRIQGLSTRRGNATFLSDVLDEARVKMREQQMESANTKAEDEETQDVLATTAVAVNDLKVKRMQNYEFSWQRALKSHGDSGMKLQYTHARLTSLLAMTRDEVQFLRHEDCEGKKTDALLSSSPDCTQPLLLKEMEALDLIYRMAVFDQVLRDSYVELEPSLLVDYMFGLCDETSKALKVLGVKTAPDEETARSRLAMFDASRAVLRQGLKILGVKPLDKM